MKVVLLAGGLGTRLAEETEVKPKPMVEIGGHPILWHIMKQYSHYGFKDFTIALGYKGIEIKRYFLDYYNLNADLSLDLSSGRKVIHNKFAEDWKIDLIDTGLKTLTAGRIKRLASWIGNATFMVTYGDGVSNINIIDLLEFHRSHKTIATVTAVRPPARFGGINFNGKLVAEFTEKPQTGEGWINGGFMVFEPAVFDYITDDSMSLEQRVLEKLAAKNQLAAYRHEGFWQCMDTLRDKHLLEDLWKQGNAPWKVWETDAAYAPVKS